MSYLDYLQNLQDPIQTEDQVFSVLSAYLVLEEVELLVLPLVPKTLVRKLFESLKSLTTLTCTMSQSEQIPQQAYQRWCSL